MTSAVAPGIPSYVAQREEFPVRVVWNKFSSVGVQEPEVELFRKYERTGEF